MTRHLAMGTRVKFKGGVGRGETEHEHEGLVNGPVMHAADGTAYVPVHVREIDHNVLVRADNVTSEDEEEVIADRLLRFTLEGTSFWRDNFIRFDTLEDGTRYGMYDEGDEKAPFFTEAFLYNLVGKDEARSIRAMLRQLLREAGYERQAAEL